MYRHGTRNIELSSHILSSWRHWAMSIGWLMLIVLLSPIIERRIMPVVAIAGAGFLGIYLHRRHNRHFQGLAVVYITAITLAIASVLMTAMNLTVEITDVYEFAHKPVNEELPFIVQLILSPIMTIASGIFLVRRLGKKKYFRTSTGRSDVSFIQRLVWQESRYQIRLLFILSSILTIVEWSYCYFYFITTDFNRPDSFFFVWLPVALYLLSIIYMGIHCASMWAFYNHNDLAKLVGPERSTILRFLIILDNKIYLTRRDIKVRHGEAVFFDTPLRAVRPFAMDISDVEAARIFAENTGIRQPVYIKFLFEGYIHDGDNNIRHYLCCPPSAEIFENSRISGGEWLTIPEVRELNHIHMLSAELSAELVHIYTVATAWKSYDAEGNRRYGIKHYRPAIRLDDIKDWNINFNDPTWIRVSRLNADKPLFHLRRFFSRLTSPSMQ